MPRKVDPPLPFADFAPNEIWLVEKTNRFCRWYVAFETMKDAREEVRCTTPGIHARLIGQYAWTIDCIAKAKPKKKQKILCAPSHAMRKGTAGNSGYVRFCDQTALDYGFFSRSWESVNCEKCRSKYKEEGFTLPPLKEKR